MDKNTVLEISDLHTHSKSKEGTVRAIDGLSLSLYEDEVLGIVGLGAACVLNGKGKETPNT